METSIRRASADDLPAIVEILNHGIKTRHSVGYLSAQTAPGMQDWFKIHIDKRFPVFLWLENENKTTGWISMSRYRKGRELLTGPGRSVHISMKNTNAAVSGKFSLIICLPLQKHQDLQRSWQWFSTGTLPASDAAGEK